MRQILSGLYVVNARAVPLGSLDQFVSVVAVRPTNYDYDITLPRQIDSCLLPLLCWLAYRIDKPDFCFWKTRFNEPNECPHALDGLRGLRSNPIPGTGFEFKNIRFG